MAVKLEITGGGGFSGPSTNVKGYSVSEQATPLDPTDSRGSVGSISVELNEKFGPLASRGLQYSTAVLTDFANGYTEGIISGVSSDNGNLTVDIDTELAFAVATVTVAPRRGSIESCVRAWFATVGVVDGFYFDAAVPTTVIDFPGWVGDLWVEVKQLLGVYSLDLTFTSGMITIRPARERELVRYRDVSNGWAIPAHPIARNIEVYYYQNTWTTNGIIYPVGGRSDNESVISVGSGELSLTEVKTNATLVSVSQPAMRTFDESPVTGSAYTIVDKDGVPVTATEWLGGGGYVKAAIDPLDASVVIITVRAINSPERAPFKIASHIGESDYASLVIVGTGNFTAKTMITLPTGADEKLISSDVGITVDNRYISTRAQAYDVGMRTSRKYAGPDMAINFSSWRVNALGATDSKRLLTFDEFNAEWDARDAAATFDTFSAYWNGQTFNQFNDFYTAQFQLEFQNQAFGNVAGSRMREDEAMYRVREATITEAGVSGTAEHDTLYEDFNIIWSGATFDSFNNSVWTGLKFDDLALAPLWR